MDAEPVTARELLDAARTRLSKAMRAATDQDAAHSTFIAVGQLLEALVVLEERVSRMEAPATPADTNVPEAVNQSRDTTAPRPAGLGAQRVSRRGSRPRARDGRSLP